MFPGFLGGSGGEESACNAGDQGSTPMLGRFPGERNGYPLQYSCLENPMDREGWWATVLGVTESDTTEQLTPFFHFQTNFATNAKGTALGGKEKATTKNKEIMNGKAHR